MNLLTNKKSALLVLSTAAILAMTGCSDDCDDCPVPPAGTATMDEVQAKDAMALNGLMYPIIVPLQSCLVDPLGCFLDNVLPLDQAGTASTASMTVGDHNCTVGDQTKGQYTVDENASTLVVTFNTDLVNNQGCFDTANTQDIQGALMDACIGKILAPSSASLTEDSTGYEVEYEGVVTCTKDTSVVFDSYIVSAFGQTDPTNNPNRHSYNMTLSMTDGIDINGTYQTEKWAPSGVATDPKVNDETWTFTGLNFSTHATTSSGFALIGDGGAEYLGAVRLGDEDNNGMKLSIGFSEFSYTSYGGTNSDVFVNGGMTASCYPDLVTYGTTDVMVDHNSTRDANGSRMPLSGTMTMAVPGFHSVPATFTAPTATAEVTITSSQGDKTYAGWRDITTTSSCSTLQEIIDRATNGL